MLNLGNILEDQTIDFKFSTNDGDGAAVTMATDGTISVYKGNSDVQTTTGITFTEDFDSVTGIHHVRIVTTDAFYAVGNDYQVVLSGATVDGNAVAAVLAHFSIENRVEDYNTALIEALNDLSAADVNAEMVDVLSVDTIAELAADPGATPTLVKALMLLYMERRNKSTQTASAHTVANNAGSTILTGSDSDSGGTFTKGKLA